MSNYINQAIQISRTVNALREQLQDRTLNNRDRRKLQRQLNLALSKRNRTIQLAIRASDARTVAAALQIHGLYPPR
jgi:endonuclease V-like protein UPF0215 family